MKAISLDHLLQQTTLARFGELALRSDDLDEVLTEACRLAAEALNTELAKVVELQDDGRTLRVRAGVGWGPGVIGLATLTAGDDTSEGHALLTGEPMISPDIATETRFNYAPFLIDNGVRAIANVLIIGGQGRPPFGILQVNSRRPRHFSQNDTAFLRSYANLLAATVERMRMDREAREGQARFRLALEAGELGSWDLDLLAGTATHTPRYDRIFGYQEAPSTWSYDTFLSHVMPEDREHVAGAFRRSMDAKVDWLFQCRIRRAGDGTISWIEGRGRPLGGSGSRPTHLHGIVADITERKRAEDELRQSHEVLEAKVAERTRELTEANAKLQREAAERERVEDALRQAHKMEAVGQLTGGIAHDFNNLLTGIIGSLDLMRKRVEQGRIGDLDRYFDAALGSANRAAALTHRLLTFSRRQPLAAGPTDVNGLIVGMEDLFRRTVGPAIWIETRLSGALWPTLCDPNQLENALLNLVINARDAMPDGGRLLIETANAGPEARGTDMDTPGGDSIVLTVTDGGTGMTPEVMARAFDPFFTTKPPGQGTGLGLSMIYGFVRQSGGQVVLRSEGGEGLEVEVFLPRYLGKGEGAEDADIVVLVQAAPGATVLVVEDEPEVRMVIVDGLADQGYTVHGAKDGSAGLQVLESGARIDLLLTDVGLPGGMNGRELANAARRTRPGLKVLFISGADGGARVEPETEIIAKPFAIDALAAKVQGLLGGDAIGPSPESSRGSHVFQPPPGVPTAALPRMVPPRSAPRTDPLTT